MPVLFGGRNLPSLVEIGFTDLPKSGGGGRVPPASPLPTSLCWQVTIDRISRDIFFAMLGYVRSSYVRIIWFTYLWLRIVQKHKLNERFEHVDWIPCFHEEY